MQKSNSKIEYTSKNLQLRKVLFIVFILVALFSFGIAAKNLFSWQPEYRIVENNVVDGNEVILKYCADSKAEYEAVKNIYNESYQKIYNLLDESSIYEGTNNIAYINAHPNQKIKVDGLLYEQLNLLAEYDNNSIALAPIYELYKGMFSCDADYQLVDYDPLLNAEIAEYVQKLLSFINDKNHLSIELFEDNYVELHVSDQYRQFAQENDINSYIDFYWLKNSFIIDYIAQQLLASGYDQGVLSCYNGYFRFLSNDALTYHYYDLVSDDSIELIADLNYAQPVAGVQYRSYRLLDFDFLINYTLENGEKRTCYIDNKDGLSKAPLSSLNIYSYQDNCTNLLLKSMKYYITDNFKWEELDKQDFYYYYLEGLQLNYNDKNLDIEVVYPQCSLNLR
ncbi:MAG: hypothetical protein Q4C64_02145 [Erysipelotrichia bacterium]|nr:hypothetical protein [Erysipelotrichia bacterium]